MMLLALAAALAIDGAGLHTPTDAAIAALPRETVILDVHGRHSSCDGPRLIDWLAAAGLPVGEKVRGAALASVVTAEAADGYKVAFGLGELDRSLGDARVVVADRCDGKPLDAATGPFRLIAAGDRRPARSARQVVRITVR